MTTSASGSWRSNSESGPSLSEVTISSMPALLKELAQPERARDAAEQLARGEIDPLRGRRGLAVGVALDLRDLVARVGGRVAVDRVVVQDAENVGRFSLLDLGISFASD